MGNTIERVISLEVQERIISETESLERMAAIEHPICIDCGRGDIKLTPIQQYEQVGKEWKLTVLKKCKPCKEENGFAPKYDDDMIGGEV